MKCLHYCCLYHEGGISIICPLSDIEIVQIPTLDWFSMDVWGPHNPVQFLGLYLWLTELHQLQNISFQAVVFGSGISEDIDKGSRQRNLQGLLDGSDTHLRTVAPTLCDRISHDQLLLEKTLNIIFEPSFNLISHLKTMCSFCTL